MTKIMVVDDEKSTLSLYTRELADEGYEILQATNPWEALERFRSDRPDLVVLDIRMPGMDGLEVLGRLLSIDRRVPIILVSAFSFYRDNFLSWAADAYVTKSSDLSEFKRTVKDLLASPKTNPGTLPKAPMQLRETV
jgi:DNA-binding response OmpR family regulator